MTARDDYPLLRIRETVIPLGQEQTAAQLTEALDEIDQLRWLLGDAIGAPKLGVSDAQRGVTDPGPQLTTRSRCSDNAPAGEAE